jgi:hypothetical protein
MQLTPRQWLALWLLAALLSAFLMLQGCQTTGSVATRPGRVAACAVFQPILWSVTDSIPTQKQAIAHNAAWKSLCGGPDGRK